jgi:hypothetical protein
MPSSAPPPEPAAFERFSTLVKRELGADDVRLLDAATASSPASNVLFAPLVGGRSIAVTFGAQPENLSAVVRRLEILVRTFAHALERPAGEARASRAPVSMCLHDELRALAQRARASDAIVLDAHSPVVWGSATRRAPSRDAHNAIGDTLERLEASRRELLRVLRETPPDAHDGAEQDVPLVGASGPAMSPSDEDEEPTPAASLRAMREVRDLPGIGALRRGRPLAHLVRQDAFGYLARSFAGIYLLVLVFEEPFDELRAERALTEALPKIELLVLALPPLDPGPAPAANVVTLRRRRR